MREAYTYTDAWRGGGDRRGADSNLGKIFCAETDLRGWKNFGIKVYRVFRRSLQENFMLELEGENSIDDLTRVVPHCA